MGKPSCLRTQIRAGNAPSNKASEEESICLNRIEPYQTGRLQFSIQENVIAPFIKGWLLPENEPRDTDHGYHPLKLISAISQNRFVTCVGFPLLFSRTFQRRFQIVSVMGNRIDDVAELCTSLSMRAIEGFCHDKNLSGCLD